MNLIIRFSGLVILCVIGCQVFNEPDNALYDTFVSGKVVDSLTNRGLDSVTVCIYECLPLSTFPKLITETYSDTAGYYEISFTIDRVGGFKIKPWKVPYWYNKNGGYEDLEIGESQKIDFVMSKSH